MRIFFSGIGGGGIGPLAMIASDAGFEVFGSDLRQSPVSKLLEERGVKIEYGEETNLLIAEHENSSIDLLVYTSALPPDHPDLEFARDNHIETTKRHGLINLIISRKGLKLLAVAGTHGKTTTSGMLGWIFEKLKIPYSHSVGSTLSFAPAGRYQPGSSYFIYEADEYDYNFLKFAPFASIITSISYDHPDTYPDQASYDQAFAEFIGKSQAAIMWDRDAERFDVAESANIQVLKESVYQNHKFPNQIGLTLAGLHNRANASLVAEFCVKQLGFELANVVDALNDFPGTDRRFERITDNLYSDFAHHPDEIQATIQLAGELNERVVVVYQPHQNVRQKALLDEAAYRDAFLGAKKVYWLPTYLSREQEDLEIIAPERLVESAEFDDIEITEIGDWLKGHIDKHLAAGELVIAMSAGDLDPWLRSQYLDK
jgi:UDP-N-acetylmuramate--alanine ligase